MEQFQRNVGNIHKTTISMAKTIIPYIILLLVAICLGAYLYSNDIVIEDFEPRDIQAPLVTPLIPDTLAGLPDSSLDSLIVGESDVVNDTTASYTPPDALNIRDKVISIAVSFEGVREDFGLGTGDQVEEFLATCGLGSGFNWCACYAKTIFTRAGVETEGANAWSPTWFPRSRLTENPKPADVFSTYSINAGRINHVGIVEIVGRNNIETIEGNVRRRDNRSGVHRLIRSYGEVHSFANWID